jgi:hypothetical protein
MAQRTEIKLLDDLDAPEQETEAFATYRFGLDGVNYEIDLTEEHGAELFAALSRFVEKARTVGREPRSGRGRSGGASLRNASTRQQSSDIRAWAKEHGHKISERGRIPATIVTEYENSNGKMRQPAGA